MSKTFFFGINNFLGFSWKNKMLKNFFSPSKVLLCKSVDDILKTGFDETSKICIWGLKEFPEVESFAESNGLPVFRVEDGFIRSLGLGSDLNTGYSLVIDSRGIYFDPRKESDLEYILNTYEFDSDMLKRAERLRELIIKKHISKYNIQPDKKIDIKTDKKIILVIGQVEDDASVIYGADGMKNIELLKKVKEKNDGFIIYKPHPDVVAGNRKGNIDKNEVLKYADMQITDASLTSLIDISDEVHTMTSLGGFEALIRGKKVFTYGMPFYAGWGLTEDERECKRRKRELSLNELIAAVYILYPKYVSPLSGEKCEVETVINEIEVMKKRYQEDFIYKLLTDFRNNIIRGVQKIAKGLIGE